MCYCIVRFFLLNFSFFFFNDTATTEIYTLSLHDALPISHAPRFHLLERPHEHLVAPECVRAVLRSEEHTSELQSQSNLVCRLLLEKKNHTIKPTVQPIPDLVKLQREYR